jgi:hypothetical protein
MANRGRPRRAARIEYECKNCGKKYELPEWQKDGTAFCSQTCYWTWRKGRPQPWLRKAPEIKVCPRCNKEFEVAGHGATDRNRRRVYCSRECAGTRVHLPPRRLSVAEAAYLAGFLDGEGSIVRAKPRVWRVAIFQSDEAVIRWIAEVTGTGFIGSRQPDAMGGNLVKKSEFKVNWYWQLYGRNAGLFLEQLLPYLRVKKERAQMAVDVLHTLDPA